MIEKTGIIQFKKGYSFYILAKASFAFLIQIRFVLDWKPTQLCTDVQFVLGLYFLPGLDLFSVLSCCICTLSHPVALLPQHSPCTSAGR